MDNRSNENFDELPTVETPEDVAVLYSWANLHGAKYRDFSASRREYRAQLRHRAAEQAREIELQAQADAEAAADTAEHTLRRSEAAAHPSEDEAERLRQAERSAQIVTAERIQAARCAEAAAQAEAAARREELEIAEANLSARRQAAVYAEESRRHPYTTDCGEQDIPGHMTDPYTPQSRAEAIDLAGVTHASAQLAPPVRLERRFAERRFAERRLPERSSAERSMMERSGMEHSGMREPAPPTAPLSSASQPISTSQQVRETSPLLQMQPVQTPHRPRGYRPDDASGVQQIPRGGNSGAGIAAAQAQSAPASADHSWTERSVPPYATRETTLPQIHASAEPWQEETAPRSWAPTRQSETAATTPPITSRPTMWASSEADPMPAARRPHLAAAEANGRPVQQSAAVSSPAPRQPWEQQRGEAAAGPLEDPTPKRRKQDMPGYHASDSDRALAAFRREQGQHLPDANATRRLLTQEPPRQRKDDLPPSASVAQPRGTDAVAPAWIYAPTSAVPTSAEPAPNAGGMPRQPELPVPQQPSVSDTLQHSRERVASRWYALKGVFEQPGQERAETEPVRQKETRTPVLAVFSLAGGVGKTSLVATVGRSLSSLGEKVLLTDTTSHGLLPFYFGASELREGTVRTFSPPSGSTDAPIYLVNYAVDQAAGDEEAQDLAVEEMATSSRGTHRMLLDLTASTGWVIRRVARLNPTVLVPLAPDMNSVISLQAIEKFFDGVTAPDGAALKIFYVLNQFDAALPLHLDVREVLRRQLGERLLPFVIRRAPAVSEALAEGMTIVDYAPDAPVAEDYMNVATWLRSQSAPATAGFRNVRWSER